MGKTTCGVALVAAFATSGCSWIFMEKPPSEHPVTTQPFCTTSKTWVGVDAVLAAFDLAYILALVEYQSSAEAAGEQVDITAGVVGGVVEGIVHLAAAGTGNGWANKCRDAHREYEQYVVSERETLAPAQVDAAARRLAPAPTGFWCTASPADTAVGACNTTLAGCESSQRKLVAAGHDVGPCTEQAAALCFAVTSSERRRRGCAPTMLSCSRARDLAVADTDGDPAANVGVCANVVAEKPTGAPAMTPPSAAPAERYCLHVDGALRCFTSSVDCQRRYDTLASEGVNVRECERR